MHRIVVSGYIACKQTKPKVCNYSWSNILNCFRFLASCLHKPLCTSLQIKDTLKKLILATSHAKIFRCSSPIVFAPRGRAMQT